jgi:hypothetical protein
MNWLLDTHGFLSRSHCGAWEPWLIGVNQLSNLLIFISYMSIPIALFSLIDLEKLKKATGAGNTIIVMFMLFIAACGLTHLMDVVSFTAAPYRFFTLIDALTAVFSTATAIMLPGVIRKALED